jgi:acetoin utilization protein AcuC
VSGTGEKQPLVVYGEVSLSYDFGPQHPLTPRRFGPAIDLLRRLGAADFLEPPEATDDQLARLHTAGYIATVRAFSNDPGRPPAAGIGPGDDPPFGDMHAAAAHVAGGSIAAVDAILAEEVEHAFHPGGGLHHAMADRAAGFCIYNDVALGVARARDAGHRVLYVDLDVHHGDGTQALFWTDPQVLTVSVHQSGLTLFPGTGSVEERGGAEAEGSALNVPLAPFSGNESWLAAVREIVPAVAEAFRPTFLVSQQGCDSHAYDPLAQLRITTRAYDEASRLLDGIAHRYCDGRWLATGGGGYDVYRVVPRAWALIWLAQEHAEVPAQTPRGWRERWAREAAGYGQSPPPVTLLDPDDLVEPESHQLTESNAKVIQRALYGTLHRVEESR